MLRKFAWLHTSSMVLRVIHHKITIEVTRISRLPCFVGGKKTKTIHVQIAILNWTILKIVFSPESILSNIDVSRKRRPARKVMVKAENGRQSQTTGEKICTCIL